MKSVVPRILLLLVLFLSWTVRPWTGLATQSVTLTWDASPDPVSGYNLYYEVVNGSSKSQIPVGATTTGTIGGLADSTSYLFYVTAVDSNGLESQPSNALTYTTGSSTANSVNTAPSLGFVPNQTVTAGNLFSVQLTATDLDVPAQTLTYSLVTGPAGASVHPSSGLFTWTPSSAQTVVVTVRVTDNGLPPLSADQSFTVVVNPAAAPANSAPVLAAIPNQTVTLGSTVRIQLSASDADVPSQTLTYALLGGPVGSSVNSSTGVFTWTPTSAQAPSTNLVRVAVTDNGNPPLSASQSFTVVVNGAAGNQAPVLTAVPNLLVSAGGTISWQLSATDTPGQFLTYSLLFGPSGASVDPVTGLFSWSAPASQAPGTNTVTVQVTDNGTPPLSDSKSFSVTITGPNTAPVLSAIPNLMVGAGNTLSWQLKATDAQAPPQTLTYRLVSGPAGAAVDPVTGLFTWTPALTQASLTVSITVGVTDNGSPAMSATQMFTVFVGSPNHPPVLSPIAGQTVTAGSSLNLSLSASDFDAGQTLTFSEVTGPAGLVVNPNGLVTWTPTAAQTPSTNLVTVEVADSGNPPLTDSQTFTVVVQNPGNHPPVLAQISDQNVSPGQVLMLSLTATDPDPNTVFTYQLVSGPNGAKVDPSTGVFTWRISKSWASSTNEVTVSVSDNGTPALSSTMTFNVIVSTKKSNSSQPTYRLANMETLNWTAVLDSERTVRFAYPLQATAQASQSTHYLEASEDLVNWTTVGPISNLSEVRDLDAQGAQKRFYRIRSEQAPGSAPVSAERLANQ